VVILAYFVMKPPLPCLPGCWWGDFSLPISWKRSLCVPAINYFLPVVLLVTVNVVLAVCPAASAAITGHSTTMCRKWLRPARLGRSST
jgi:hypothetical protein